MRSYRQSEKGSTWYFSKVIDVLVIVLLVGVLVVIIRQLYTLFREDLFSAEVKHAIDNGLFVLILLELVVILLFYLRDHHVKVERVVELGIISIIREIIFHFFDLEVMRLLALGGILLVLGALFYVEKMFSQREKLTS